MVCSLKSPTSGWCRETILQNFLQDEATTILALPYLDSNSLDILSWCYDHFGNYNVKSGYWFTRDCLKKPSCSDSTTISA
ncbi:hypothetical protein ACOSQ3_021745 [Xanthoceras sorbifolium]